MLQEISGWWKTIYFNLLVDALNIYLFVINFTIQANLGNPSWLPTEPVTHTRFPALNKVTMATTIVWSPSMAQSLRKAIATKCMKSVSLYCDNREILLNWCIGKTEAPSLTLLHCTPYRWQFSTGRWLFIECQHLYRYNVSKNRWKPMYTFYENVTVFL